MSKHKLTDWSARLGVSAAVPLVAAAVAAAPQLEAQAGDKEVTKGGPGTMIVINHEEQYSLWPASMATPKGWEPVTDAAPARTAAASLRDYVGGNAVYVIINHEEQFSLWEKGETIPKGWTDTGRTCAANACGKTLARLTGED